MKKLIYLVFFAAIVAACGQSYEETKRITRLERQRLAREDSAALKVAVIPTLDCLPFFVARHYNLFDSLGADIRLKAFSSQPRDCLELRLRRITADLTLGGGQKAPLSTVST